MAFLYIEPLYFSATGNSRRMVDAVVQGISETSGCPVRPPHDITPFASRKDPISFSREALAVVGCPVYAGRVPNKIMPFFRDSLKGDNTPAVVVLTYGNRAYDDALKEMTQLLTRNGFVVVGAITQPSQHTFSDTVATGRPNSEDLFQAHRFGSALASRLAETEPRSCFEEYTGELVYYTPLTSSGTKANFLKAKPDTDRTLCNGCGECVGRCPMGSISAEEPWLVEGTCIKCHACIAHCPRKARRFTDADFLSHTAMIVQHFLDRKEAEYYGEL